MKMFQKTIIAVSALTLGAMVYAQQTPPPAKMAMPAASQDPASVPSGAYILDSHHASVVVRLAHGGGISRSVFRFDTVSGNLDWNSAKPEASKVNVNVDPKSISSYVAGFGAELAGERFLNTAKYPESSFVSTSITRTGPTTGIITGNLTFMGVTKPISVNANLVGGGKGMRGNNVIGFSGVTTFKRSDFGFTSMMGPIGDDVELTLDFEFGSAPKSAPTAPPAIKAAPALKTTSAT